MAGKLNPCGRIVQITLIVINALFFLAGVGITAGGSYLLVRGDELVFFTGNSHFSGAALIVAAGVFAMIISAVGVIGALFKNKIILGIYAVIVGIIILLEIVAAILGFVFREDVQNKATDNALGAIQDYRPENNEEFKEDVNEAIDFIQNTFECCGWNETEVWFNTPFFDIIQRFPESCECDGSSSGSGSGEGPGSADGCRIISTGQSIYDKTCQDGVVNRIRQYAGAVGAIGIVFAIVEVAAVLLAAGLIYCLVKGQEYTTV